MAYRRYVTWIVVFVAVAGIALATITIADAAKNDANAVEQTVTNESVSQEIGLWQYVNVATQDDTAGFNDTVTVYNASDGELVAGTDYEWNATDGTITYFNTANVTDGATGSITYTYLENTRSVSVLSRVIDPVVAFISWSPLLVGGLGLGAILLAVGAFVARKMAGNSGVQRNR